MKKTKLFLILGLLFLSFTINAADDVLIIELPDVDVQARKAVEEAVPGSSLVDRENSSTPTTIIRVDLENRPLSTVTEEIARTAGVSIKRYGGLGDFATISLRGSSQSQLNLYLDGIPLSQASSFFNLGNINAANLERIEVYRGQSPLGFGRSAIGGVINLVPRRSPGELSVSAKFIYGSFATKGFNLLSSYGGENFSTIFGIGHLQSKGDFTYEDDNGTPFEDDDDEIKKRKNNALDQLDLYGNFSLWGEWGKVKLAHYYFRKEKGIPGIGSYQSESAHAKNEFNQSSLSYQKFNVWEKRLGLELKAFYSSKVDAFNDPEGQIGIGRTKNRNETISAGGSSLVSCAYRNCIRSYQHFLRQSGKFICLRTI